jgi:hypothetical protein
VEKHGTILMSLNPPYEVDPDTVVKRITYKHLVGNGKVSNRRLIKDELLIESSIPSHWNPF